MSQRYANIDIPKLNIANSNSIVQNLASFSSKNIEDWLGGTHKAKTGQLLRADGKPYKKLRQVRARFTDAELAELLSVTAPNHCLDGWGYLARSISALASQDMHAVRHLSYYAQLRAALSILASVGIGVFNTVSFVVDHAGGIHNLHTTTDNKPTRGTHLVAWEALLDWVGEPQNADYMLSVIKVGNSSMKDCVQALWPSTMTVGIASALIKAWGLDLERGIEDRGLRNTSSYAVHELNPLPNNLKSDMNYIQHIWKMLEPSGGAGFDNLDAYLLRNILWDNHQRVHSNKDYGSGEISSRYYQLPQSIKNIASQNFLTGNTSKTKPVILSKANSNRKNNPLGMTSRAILLLRVATAFNSHLFSSAGYSADGTDLHAWLHPIGVQKGFWNAADGLVNLGDLWNEVSYAIQDLKESLKNNAAVLPNSTWLNYERTGFPVLSQVERAGMWGLCP